MKVSYYGLYDQKAKEFISLFTCANDEVAARSAQYIVRGKDFDRIAGRDYVLQHVFDIDSSSGLVLDNNVRLVVALAPLLEDYLQECKKVEVNPDGE